jgi:CubicO group peptidase (beta-lactamase class C family)
LILKEDCVDPEIASTFHAAVASLGAQSGDTPWPTVNWMVSTPEAQGMDAARLADVSKFIQETCPTRYSLLVVRHGRIVFERYYGGTRAADANNICSMSKSILSALAGIAFDEGRLRSAGQKLAEFFPDYIPSDSDPRKLQIRLQDVLSMTGGLQWDDLTATGAPGGDLSRCLVTSNWLRCVPAAPMKQDPGTAFNYDSGLSHAVSGILSKVTGMRAASYAASRLFAPPGIYCPRWSHRIPEVFQRAASNVWLTVRDLARFGLPMLRNGEWNGRRVMSSEWLDTSMRLRVRGGSAGWRFGDYAYFWWKKTLAGYPVTLASGYGGPKTSSSFRKLDLLVVTTARSDLVPPFEAYQQSYNIVSNYVLPAVKGAA